MTGLRAMTVLQVADVRASVAFYERLGFARHHIWEHEGQAQFCIVQFGQVTIALQRADGAVPVNSHWAAYVYVPDIGALYGTVAKLGLPGLTELRRGNFYGCDDFDIRDPDGHLICFGQDMNPTDGPGLETATAEA